MTHSRGGLAVYFAVFAALLLLLALTVEVARHDLGEWNFVAAISIASMKAFLIILFFMHVRHSVRLTKLVVCAGFLWLAILFALSLADYFTREWPPRDYRAATENGASAASHSAGAPRRPLDDSPFHALTPLSKTFPRRRAGEQGCGTAECAYYFSISPIVRIAPNAAPGSRGITARLRKMARRTSRPRAPAPDVSSKIGSSTFRAAV